MANRGAQTGALLIRHHSATKTGRDERMKRGDAPKTTDHLRTRALSAHRLRLQHVVASSADTFLLRDSTCQIYAVRVECVLSVAGRCLLC
jgi:hypothetical protein